MPLRHKQALPVPHTNGSSSLRFLTRALPPRQQLCQSGPNDNTANVRTKRQTRKPRRQLPCLKTTKGAPFLPPFQLRVDLINVRWRFQTKASEPMYPIPDSISQSTTEHVRQTNQQILPSTHPRMSQPIFVVLLLCSSPIVSTHNVSHPLSAGLLSPTFWFEREDTAAFHPAPPHPTNRPQHHAIGPPTIQLTYHHKNIKT